MQITPNIIYNVQLYKNANYKWASVIKMLEKSTRSLRSGREKQKAKSRKQKAIAIETKPRRTQKKNKKMWHTESENTIIIQTNIYVCMYARVGLSGFLGGGEGVVCLASAGV